MSIKVSIIVPVYKVENEIERCLASVVVQNYENFELIVVDDSSPDHSINIAKAYLEKTQRELAVQYVHHTENQGLSVARNSALEIATGDYIFYLDSDDEIASPDVLSFLVDLVKRQPILPDVILGGYYRVDKKGLAEEHGINRYVLDNNHDVVKYYVEERFWPSAAVKLVNHQFLIENDIGFKPDIYHEDELWFFNVVLKAKIVIGTPKIIYDYWVREGSITSAVTDKHIADMITVVLEMYHVYQQHDEVNHYEKSVAIVIERFRRRALKMLIQYGSKSVFIAEQLDRLRLIQLPILMTKNVKFMSQNILMKMPQSFIIRYLSAKWRRQ